MKPNDQPQNAQATVERYLAVKDRVWHATINAGREPASVALIAVTKTFEVPEILPVLEQGHVYFGENRVQEAQRKWPRLRDRFPAIGLHLIGPLQTNKARDAVALFDCIQTLDRPKLAVALASEIEKQGKAPKLFVQVNVGEEAQKAGVAPHDAEAFIAQCQREIGLSIEGLMCIPPAHRDPVPYFRRLAAMRDACGLSGLSMGMSGDYEAAIAEGATAVRVGSAIFGSR